MILELLGDFDSPSGYSRHARAIARAASEAGVTVQLVQRKKDRATVELDPWWQTNWNELLAFKGAPDARIFIETPEYYRPEPDVLSIGYTAWETSKIPTGPDFPASHDWVLQMNRMDEIWTPATFAIEAFRESGVTDIFMRYMPLPADTDVATEELPIVRVTHDLCMREIPRERRKLVVGAVGQWNGRKNMEALIRGFTCAFGKQEAVLVLKTYGRHHGDPEEEAKIQRLVATIRSSVNRKDPPDVILVQEPLSEDDMAAFYKTLDVFVTTSRGEGYCLPAAQAMAAGVPVIATGWSAFPDYITDYETGFLLKYRLEPVTGMATPWYRPDQLWAEVDPLDLIEKLRMMYVARTDPALAETIRKVAAAGRDEIRDRFGTLAVGAMIRESLEQALEWRKTPVTA